jgi:hypothetical protein
MFETKNIVSKTFCANNFGFWAKTAWCPFGLFGAPGNFCTGKAQTTIGGSEF